LIQRSLPSTAVKNRAETSTENSVALKPNLHIHSQAESLNDTLGSSAAKSRDYADSQPLVININYT
jgi:hypothetical protein